jgi:hypothetical protein
MEKMGVIKPGLTPEINDDGLENKSADCKSPENVDNKERKIDALDNDFRKRAANQVSDQLNT